jgi:hypothetical protein
MKLKTSVLLAASALALACLPSCVVDASGGGAASQYEPYNSPARVTRLKNGNYLVNIDNKVVSFDDAGRLTSRGIANTSEVYHAQMAVNDYIRGHRGDHMHPNYNYQHGSPKVRPQGNGNLEVMLPGGGVVLYDRYGNVIQKGRTVTGSQLRDANKAVQSHIRENNSSRGYSGV